MTLKATYTRLIIKTLFAPEGPVSNAYNARMQKLADDYRARR